MKKLMEKVKVASYWLILIVALVATIGIGAFREKFNVQVVTEEKWHQMVHPSLEAKADVVHDLK